MKITKNKIFVVIFAILAYTIYLFIPLYKKQLLEILTNNKEMVINTSLIYLQKITLFFIFYLIFDKMKYIFIDKVFSSFLNNFYSHDRVENLKKIINLVLWIGFFMVTITILIGDVTALVASLGLIGFGLTFALQKPILNFVGWLTILVKNIYSEGDRIKVGNFVGDVREIQLMNTVLDGLLENSEVLSGKTVSFPNELILTGGVINYTKENNYLLNELMISITYESNYNKAIKLLNDIIVNQVIKNKKKYIKKITKIDLNFNKIINEIIDPMKPVPTTNKNKMINSLAGKILNNSSEVEQKSKKYELEKKRIEAQLQHLDDDFTPSIRVELLDSSIQLIAQFKSPYDEIKQNRTEIILSFLDTIKDHKDIEIAYPHLQIVKHESK